MQTPILQRTLRLPSHLLSSSAHLLKLLPLNKKTLLLTAITLLFIIIKYIKKRKEANSNQKKTSKRKLKSHLSIKRC